jgi:hypothetical protein
VHDHDLIRDCPDYFKVVGHKNIGDTKLLLEFVEESQDFASNRSIE